MAQLDPVVVREDTKEARARWHWRLFGIVAAICALFVVLTTLAMLVYPGGTFPNPGTHGYQFFINYFSDLGQTRTQSGASNYPSMLLFASAVTLIGLALAVFFRAFSTFFRMKATAPSALRLNKIATRFGTASAVCFIGLAAVPENLFAAGHFLFVQGAFDFLLVAIVLEIVTLRRTPGISSWLTVVNGAFVALLFGYIMLMVFGPSSKTLIGDQINAVGQKFIVYVAIATIFAQALIVRAHLPRPTPAVAARVPEFFRRGRPWR
jgi:hypothetical protein